VPDGAENTPFGEMYKYAHDVLGVPYENVDFSRGCIPYTGAASIHLRQVLNNAPFTGISGVAAGMIAESSAPTSKLKRPDITGYV